MKRIQSSFEYNISEYYFAVYPISLNIHRTQECRISFQFLKQLQRLAKFQVPTNIIGKGQQYYFSAPNNIVYFRVLNQKSLQYKWLIYMEKMQKNTKNRQSSQEVKINLKNIWKNFNQNKEMIFEEKIQFVNLKCQLRYLVTIGDNKQILENIQKYFKVHIHNQRFNEIKHSLHSTLNVQQSNSVRRSHIVMEDNNETQIVNLLVNETLPIHLKAPLGSNIISNAGQMKITKRPFDNISSKASSFPVELSNQEMHIANSIENDIAEMSSILQCMRPDMLGRHTESFVQLNQIQSKEQAQKIKKMLILKKLQISQSQIINEKGQILITPFYHHPKYYFIIVAIIFIFIGLMILRPHSKEHSNHMKKPKVHKKKAALKKSKQHDRENHTKIIDNGHQHH